MHFPGMSENSLSRSDPLQVAAQRGTAQWVFMAYGGHEDLEMSRALDHIVGVYELPDHRLVTISREGMHAFAQLTALPGRSELLPETPTRYFLPAGIDASTTFSWDENEPASSMLVEVNGVATRANRVKECSNSVATVN